MAITLKRKRDAVSYKEPSSDEDFSDEPQSSHAPTRQRTTPRRTNTRQHSSAADDASVRPSTSNRTSHARSSAPRSKNVNLRGRQNISYRESSSDDDWDEDYQEEVEVTTPRRAPRVQPKVTPQTNRTSREISRNKGRQRRSLGAPLKRRRSPEQAVDAPQAAIISDGNIPPWATLPYHVLLQIFVYASHPLHDENFTPTPSIIWLARAARMCSAFTKPALTALYRNPPIFAVRQNRKDLVHRISSSVSKIQQDYAVMVKRLELDATRMSKLTDTANSVSDLAALITSSKTLKEIDIFDPFDKPPYRPRSRQIRRWYYPEELFEALRQSELRLMSWRWNSAYCAHGLVWIKDIHSTTAFQTLRDISLTKFHSDSTPKTEEDGVPSAEELLGTALAALPALRSLTFETCSILNERLLPLLPHRLKSLTITNCRDIFADPLQAFLTSHGRELEELILDHNQCLDMSFLVNLKTTCPKLEVLKMDMHYYNSLSTTSDNEPLYDHLLEEGEIPTWPSTLQVINLEFLRNWTPVAAIAFFTSLIEAAEDLPWLREIVITAMVDIDWRQRAKFRRKWTARFQNVFARRAKPPSPHLVSLRAFREWKAASQKNSNTTSGQSVTLHEGQKHDQAALEGPDSDSDAPLISSSKNPSNEKWNTRRLRDRVKSDESDESDVDSDESDDAGADYIQGLCYKVLFRIDNSRPQEQIYDEADFLDDEVSGDEDWNGNDTVEDTYAW
ncbi:hypothetical protein BU24DRAFT_433461 [Aaosphaeria arxii CBS 175.79]|uniref:Uncharacterized protein n=1 Tax=Aaosphaeria arxii CBS 175.79 TaxID=1450172 RepID=A0A6A5XW79_9PLEO|nr:uncharacterized protein BU24DRAFT_433461 [Aaosphaeria arxii CBS 175.79]KAF2016494.1 hypothetical protein BU24DRAFT_433461 [Aaosphaeria arxii CBS 175.79]